MNEHASEVPALAPAVETPAAPASDPATVSEPRLRLWPAVVLVALMWTIILLSRWLVPGTITNVKVRLIAPFVTAILLAFWWLLASRAPRKQRVQDVGVLLAAGAGAVLLCHPSFKLGLVAYGLSGLSIAWVAWLLLTARFAWPVRHAGLLTLFGLVTVACCMARFDGIYGDFSEDMNWRWAPTAEDKLAAELKERGRASAKNAGAAPGTALVLRPGDWPGFRGPNRDSRVVGARIATDWGQHSPREVWRHHVGPAWSSFAVIGNRLFTQEQRGDDELVVCYAADTGDEFWTHKDPGRFAESWGGIGPRATPTFDSGRIYTIGARGKLNCLEAGTGRAAWSHDVVKDSGSKVPEWGFACSPLVDQGVVTVFAGGPGGKSVLGYHVKSGDLAWAAGDGQTGYCSTHPAKLAGVQQVLGLSNVGLTAFEPARGKRLWQYDWQFSQIPRVDQPALLGNDDVLIGTGNNQGLRRVHVQHQGEKWEVKEVWSSRALSPYFNDFVTHKGHLYGFDGQFFTCANLDDGQGNWRVRGYGNGQVLLLADQGLLLVISEKGEVVLVEANPAQHKELARFKALSSKTWNHPVVAHGKLFVRNSEEMACYELNGDTVAKNAE